MLRFALFIACAAPAAFAFTPDHLVVVDGAVVYDDTHKCGDDYIVCYEYIIARLPYWTPVVVEAVYRPGSERASCIVTLEDGRHGLTYCKYLGWALRAVKDDVPIYDYPIIGDIEVTVVGHLEKGEVVAFRGGAIEYEGIITADRLEGWVRKSDIEPVVPLTDEIPPIPKPDE